MPATSDGKPPRAEKSKPMQKAADAPAAPDDPVVDPAIDPVIDPGADTSDERAAFTSTAGGDNTAAPVDSSVPAVADAPDAAPVGAADSDEGGKTSRETPGRTRYVITVDDASGQLAEVLKLDPQSGDARPLAAADIADSLAAMFAARQTPAMRRQDIQRVVPSGPLPASGTADGPDLHQLKQAYYRGALAVLEKIIAAPAA